MSYYTLPRISCKINLQNLNLKFDEANEIFINKTLSKYLNQVKKNISKHNKNWDIVKKYTNPYEYIHTPFPNSKYLIPAIQFSIDLLIYAELLAAWSKKNLKLHNDLEDFYPHLLIHARH